ncbi:MAG TPA: hypothetical protein VH020_07030 [Stellaceae bacterium]|jgi:hypothetical protein|nr:hypothetical protein [Stellaceae bacterium]
MAQKSIWISYDLGIMGDYSSLYVWLDEHSAEECGDSVAFILYEYKGDLIAHLKRDLERSIKLDRKSRIYIVFQDTDSAKIKGRFVFGRRKSAVWTGASPRVQHAEADE